MSLGRSDGHIAEATFIGLLSVALYAVFPAFSDIYRLWYREAGVAIVGGLGAGQFEYPPLAAFYFEALAWLPSARWAVVVNALVMVLASVGVARVLATYQGEGPQQVRLWSMSPAVLLFLPINWDVGVAYLTIVAVASLYQRGESVAGLLHGAGISSKVFPAATLFPLVPLIEGRRKRALFLGSAVAVVGASYAAYMVVRPDTWRIHLDFASSRSDHGETLWGVVDWAVRGLGGAGLDVATVGLLSSVAVGLALLVVTAWVATVKPTFAEAAGLALLVFLLFNKVMKPQYVLWVLPFLAWNRSSRRGVHILEAAAIVQFAVIYFPLPIVLARLATLFWIGALGFLGYDFIDRRRRAPVPVGS